MFLYLLPRHTELSKPARLDIERLKAALLQTFSPEHVTSVNAGNNFVFLSAPPTLIIVVKGLIKVNNN